ncbi:hypothetical protein ID866_9658 [Astraeus odoratus]|nr:hypothetical protein ID866_9658 [Astraeus odoratus]
MESSLPTTSYHQYPYHLKQLNSYATSMTPEPRTSPSNVDFTLAHVPTLPTLHKDPKPQYPQNLTPNPSNLQPDCTAWDCIALWLPHPDSAAAYSASIPEDAQARIKAVTLQAWADSTRAAYRAGLLVFHIFCDKNNIPDPDRAPVHSELISHFISLLTRYYSGQTMQGYMYGVWAWHMLNNLPWELHKDHIVV